MIRPLIINAPAVSVSVPLITGSWLFHVKLLALLMLMLLKLVVSNTLFGITKAIPPVLPAVPNAIPELVPSCIVPVCVVPLRIIGKSSVMKVRVLSAISSLPEVSVKVPLTVRL